MSTITKGKVLREDLNLYDGVTLAGSRTDSTGGTFNGQRVNDFVDVLQVYGDGETRDGATIQYALDTLGSNNRAIGLSPGSWTVSSDITFPSNITLIVAAGATLEPASGVTVTINGTLFRYHGTYTGGDGDVTLGDNAVDILSTEIGATLSGNTFSGDQTVSNASSPKFRAVDTTNTVQVDLQAENTVGRIGTASNHGLRVMTNDTEAVRVDTSQRFVFGHTASIAINDLNPKLQVHGTSFSKSSNATIAWGTGSGASSYLGRSASSTIGSYTALSDGDKVGEQVFVGDDGTDLDERGLALVVKVDGTVSSNDVPMEWGVNTHAPGDASNSTTRRFGVTAKGNVYIGDTSNALATDATDGFLHIPSMAGAASGTPTSISGVVPLVYDSTNNKIGVYDGGWIWTSALS